MAQGLRLEHRQTQSLTMTPQLAQSIKLLQFGSQELMAFVHSEIEKNPLLELDSGSVTYDAEDRQEGTKSEKELVSSEMGTDAAEREADIDASFENVYDVSSSGPTGAGSTDRSAPGNSKSGGNRNESESLEIVSSLGEQPSLAQYLEAQIGLAFHEPEARRIATYIAHSLDEDGYFRENISEAADATDTDSEQFQRILKQFQTLEPTGIGARSLAECLQLQLIERDRHDPAMAALIENLALLAKREYAKLVRLCGISQDELVDMVQEIRRLDPRPAAQYEAVLAETVVADVIITQKPDLDWAIELNPETLPKVLIDRDYHAELERAVDTEEGQDFVADCISNASWLVKSLDQRANTLLKVATEIVRQQDMFFAEGIAHLKPMNLKTVAEAIKMHESTVSRVTTNKYLRCKQGIFELKFFFSSSVSASSEQGELSSESVKYRIKQLVDAESPAKILSDDQIVSALQETGIEIARRTVAKYREAMRIPSSVQRRAEKRQSFVS